MSEAYRQAGVDIDAGNEAVEGIKKHVARTNRPEVLGGLGGFGGMFALKGYKEPVLIAATDGVGTKLKLAFITDRHDSIGIDCVAMCVNDLIVQGAEPLFFLDYVGTGKLSPTQVEQIVKGIADGCQEAGCALIGGETAELPGMYAKGEYDVAGFSVGAVERDQLLDGRTIQPGDALIGLASNGLHSNGFSLVRRVLLGDEEEHIHRLHESVPWGEHTWSDELLTPTRIYVRSFHQLIKQFTVKGAAHITGGGLVENVPRMLPKGLCAQVWEGSWEIPAVFKVIKEQGSLKDEDLYRTFNMGIGMVLCLPWEEAEAACEAASALGEKATLMGRVSEGEEPFMWSGGMRR
ncbi:phosphoribosylformylglycinamidine cyclo-ligase [Marininema halotolerans]|uniref:Phosphoribosylformylglycinamidine cyclo-ligase n=1 Tax=Marininema halotolerans TaxID=1155944 RepID=A0A1I6SEM2_9BACL|nr:phosphoribosylformylglycinamidine cyclo-ligase [Marininema halotolerans]SFS75353.1 phosphoribosylformylglycinamidine cyclo-ligase [Marininema halotolerans]